VEVDAARSTELALGPWTSCEVRAGAVWGSRRVREAFRGLEKMKKSSPGWRVAREAFGSSPGWSRLSGEGVLLGRGRPRCFAGRV
jgi:hypothetical protein